MKLIIRLLLQCWFRFRAYNTEVLNAPGPVLLIPNHVSWFDWAFLYVVLDDDWRFVTSSTTSEASWFHRKVMVNKRTFPVDNSSPYAAKRMAEFLEQGGRLVLFAEGRISITGSMMKLYDGTGFLLHKTRAKVITCYLRNAVRAPFVRHTGWTRWFPTVSAHFSAVLESPDLPGVSNSIARKKLTTWLRDQMLQQNYTVEMEHGPTHVLAAIAEMAGQQPRRVALEDVTEVELTYRKLMTSVQVLAGCWRSLLARTPGGGHVGVLLPNVNSVPLTVLSLWAAGRVPALLNFSTGMPVMVSCADLAGLRQVITSRGFAEKAKLDLSALTAVGLELIFLEDVKSQVTLGAKLAAGVGNWFACGAAYRRLRAGAEATAVILFTSGSEGMPKGVELTHRNLLANIRQISAHLDVTDHERFFNAMPLFHSFGLTTCTLFPLVRGLYIFLYPSPLHYRVVPAVVYDKVCTVMVGTNTFFNGYGRKANPYDFSSVKYLVGGAEKVQEATSQTWARKFGIRILEGYGATECSPVLCVNSRIEPQFGSVGRFLPGIDFRIEPVEGITGGGRLFVRGANVMKGYLNPEPNQKFLALGGWYDTGDLARVDEDGFVFLVGRLKRFAKISGEMVSLVAVEDALDAAFPQFGPHCEVAIVALPCEDKGEMLVAATNEKRLTLNDVRDVLRSRGFANLAIPRELHFMDEIPKLGTGKTDHRLILASLPATKA